MQRNGMQCTAGQGLREEVNNTELEMTGQVLLDQRPPMTLEETNWDDHSYYVYSIVQNTLDTVSAPAWVAEEL